MKGGFFYAHECVMSKNFLRVLNKSPHSVFSIERCTSEYVRSCSSNKENTMTRSAVRLCAQPGCMVPLSVSSPFKFCNKHRKPAQPLPQKRLTHTPSKPAPAPPPKDSVAKPKEESAQDAPTPSGHQVNRTKSTTKQGIDLLKRKIARKASNKTDTPE